MTQQEIITRNDNKSHCEKCGIVLTPAAAFFEGEPTTVGFIPCCCDRPIRTDSGVVYPGEDEHTEIWLSGNYSINDVLSPVSK